MNMLAPKTTMTTMAALTLRPLGPRDDLDDLENDRTDFIDSTNGVLSIIGASLPHFVSNLLFERDPDKAIRPT
jgi:hypothetical protein